MIFELTSPLLPHLIVTECYIIGKNHAIKVDLPLNLEILGTVTQQPLNQTRGLA